MHEWRVVALGDVTSQSRDAVKVERDKTYPLLGVRWYAQGAFLRETVTPEAATTYRVRAGQFIYNRLFAWKGSFGLITEDLAGSYVSNEFPLFDCDPERLLPEYLAYVFGRPAVWGQIERVSTGTTASRNRWNERSFNTYSIALPPVDEQRRIVTVMSAVDAQIEVLEVEVGHARTTSRALLTHLFTVDQHSTTATLSECATLVTGRAFPAKHQGHASGETPYVKVSDLGSEAGSRWVSTAANWVGADVAKELTARICPAGTVLFPIIGAAMLTEKRRILSRAAAFDQNVMGLIPNDKIVPEYLFAAMSSIRLGDHRQTGAVPSVNQVLVGAIEIRFPSRAEQEEIAASVGAVLDAVERLSSELAALRAVRADLLSALLSQEITVDAAVDKFAKAA